MRYETWDALGNRYAIVEQPEAGALTPERVARVCASDGGLGTDGVLEVVEADERTATLVVWNPDGSVAETSGNGLRLAAAWLTRRTGAHEVALTSAGRTTPARIRTDGAVELELGPVEVGADETIEVDGEEVELTPVSVGNPHAVVRREALTRDELLRLGPAIEAHPRFPERTNVQLVRVVDLHTLDVLVWERGAGETSASGSSSTAAAATAVARGWCASPVTVRLPGGELEVRLASGVATLIGPVALVDEGDTDL